MLKLDWMRVKFGEVVRLNTERCADPLAKGIERYVGLEHMTPGDLRVRAWGLVAEGTTFTNLFRPGQVLFGKRRAYQRKVAVAEFSGVCSGDIYVFESRDPERLLPELLPFICQTERFFEHAVGTSAGSLSPRTNWTRLAEYEFALPPLDEQSRYVSVLAQIELILEAFIELSTSTNTLADSVIAEKLLSLSSNPYTELDKLGDVRYGLTVNEKRRNYSNRLPYLRVANVLRDQLDLSEVKEIGFFEDDNVYELSKGDVLVVEGHASLTEIGRTAIWDKEIEKCLHQNHLIRVRCEKELDPRFLTIYLNSAHGRRYFLRHAKSTSGLNTINSTVVKQIPIPILPMYQQLSIVETVAEIRSGIASVQIRYEATKSLKQVLLLQIDKSQ